MIVVDSSGWLEFLTDGVLADQYAKHLRQPAAVLTPTIVVCEVYKHAKRLMPEEEAVDAVAAMQKTRIVPLTDELALVAADLSLAHKLPMADSIVLATAQAHDAEVVTSDADLTVSLALFTSRRKRSPERSACRGPKPYAHPL